MQTPHQNGPVTKADLSARIADRAGLTYQDAWSAVGAFVGVVEDALARGESVVLSGFGKFQVVERAGHVGVNPRTGETFHVKPYKNPRFTAGTRLKATVRGDS